MSSTGTNYGVDIKSKGSPSGNHHVSIFRNFFRYKKIIKFIGIILIFFLTVLIITHYYLQRVSIYLLLAVLIKKEY